MTTTEEWLRRGLGEGNDGPLPDRLQPSRLRRQARTARRRRNAAGAAAVVLVAGLGVSQGDRVGALRDTSPADQPPVVLVSPTVSPTAPAGTVAVTGIRLVGGEGKETLTFAYRAPRDVVVSVDGPDGARGDTGDSSGGPGELTTEFRPGRWNVKAVRMLQGRSVTVATTEVEVPPSDAWPRVDDLTISVDGRCRTGGPVVIVEFTAGTATSAEVTLVVKHEDGGTREARRSVQVPDADLEATGTDVRVPWPCDAKGFADSRSYSVTVVARDAGGRYAEDSMP